MIEETPSRRKFITVAGMAAGWPLAAGARTDRGLKKLVMIAGRPSHPAGMHEFNAGCLLLQECLAGVPGLEVSMHPNHWVGTSRRARAGRKR